MAVAGGQTPGFRTLEVLHRSARTTIVRALRADGTPVILKSRTASDLHHEGTVLQRLQGEGIVRFLGEEVIEGRPTLVLADSGGRSLRQHAGGRALAATEVVDLALAATRALATAHRHGVVHRNVTPSNLVVVPPGTGIELIDFGLGTRLAEEAAASTLIGTLDYASPEQTGRTGQAVDARSDLYSLGATLYELLTGSPPFVSSDALEVVHGHLARRPVPPHEARPAIPRGLSDVVMMLLAKSPADRYQSAEGLLYDLAACREALGRPGAFPLGTRDIPRTLAIPQRLFGRERERAALGEALERALDGSTEICLVSGPAGVGKSSLVEDVRLDLARRRGHLLVGKGELLGRSVPYAPLVAALGELARQVLTMPTEAMSACRDQLLDAVGDLGGLLAATVPEMGPLIGLQPPAPELAEAEAAHRMDRLLVLTLQSLSGPQRPLALLLDDLQWADLGTLRVAEALSAENHPGCLLLVAAWRSDEVDAAHPLHTTLERLRTPRDRVTELPLDDLGGDPVDALLAETLRCTTEEVAPLARIVERKTHGNPFFVRQLLIDLHGRGHLRFSPEKRRWCWSVDEIEQAGLTDNVIRMLEGRLGHLPALTLEALQAAACVGQRFDLEQAADALGVTAAQMEEALWPALEEGLVLARSSDPSVAGSSLRFRFLHDRVHEAVYGTLAPHRREALHLGLGRRLASAVHGDDGLVFEAVRHLNLALPLLDDPVERHEVARLNLRAGRLALRAGAFDAASTCLDAGLALVGDEQGWRDDYALAVDLHLLAASAAALLGQADRSEALLDAALRHCQGRFDRARALQVRGRTLMRRGQYADAFSVFLDALDLLGERLPRRSSRMAAAVHLSRTMARVLLKGAEGLASLPRSEEPTHRLAMSLLSLAVPSAFLSAPDVVPRLVLRMVERSMGAGRTPETSTGVAGLATIQAAFLGNFALAERLGKVALRLADTSEPGSEQVRTRWLVTHLVFHWTNPHRPVVEATPDLFRASLDAGDHVFAPFLAWAWCRGSYLCGVDLATVQRRLDAMEAAVRSLRRGEAPLYWRVQQIVMKCLTRERPPDLHQLALDLQPIVAQAEADEDIVTLSTCAVEQALLHLLFREPARALPLVDRLETLLPGVRGTPEMPYHHYVATLVRLASLPAASHGEARRLRRQVNASRALLARQAALCPANNAHRSQLVEAEAARAEGDRGRAAEAYDRAAATAREHGHSMDEALALERAGLLYLEDGRQRLAAVYLEDARQAWRRWGAAAKVAHLEASHGHLLHPQARPSEPVLDTMTVVKAMRAISGEIVWESLLQRLLHVAVENAGARRGLLILQRDGRLRIEAEVHADRPDQVELAARPLHEAEDLAASVARYAVRTAEVVVVDDAASDPSHAGDPYVRRAGARSIMAVPILSLGRTDGVLYLENNLAAGVFTSARAEVLRLLSAQMAIALQNARQVLELRASQGQVLAERELRHAEALRGAAMEARKNGLAAYLGIASHDLKSPLASIQMWARQVGAGQLDPAHAQAYIEAACSRATSLVRTYLDAVAVETGGQLALSRRPFDLARLVEDEVDFLLRRYLPEDRARVALEWDLEPLVLEADAERLGQVVGNLVGNALEYCPLGTRIALTLTRHEACARLVLEDEGPGIPEEMREGLFRPFERGNHELSSSGLGLWICRVIVEAHGGRIGLDDVRRGMRFWIEIPLCEGAAAQEGRK